MKYLLDLPFVLGFVIIVSESQAAIPSSFTGVPTPRAQDNAGATCTAIDSASICSGVGYFNTSFPNLRQHENQAEAEMEVTDFNPLFETKCSLAVQDFFCSYYYPFCSYVPGLTIKLQPCMHYCEYVRMRCEPEFDNYPGLEWPIFLNCSLFLDRAAGELCLGPDDPSTIDLIVSITSSPPPTSTYILPPTPSPTIVSSSQALPGVSLLPSQSPGSTLQCSQINHQACRDINYTNTTLAEQSELNAALNKYKDSLEAGCSHMLAYFLCSFYAPGCGEGDLRTRMPCRELCNTVQQKCSHSFSDGWPDEFTCSKLPSSNSENCSTPFTRFNSARHESISHNSLLLTVLFSIRIMLLN